MRSIYREWFESGHCDAAWATGIDVNGLVVAVVKVIVARTSDAEGEERRSFLFTFVLR